MHTPPCAPSSSAILGSSSTRPSTKSSRSRWPRTDTFDVSPTEMKVLVTGAAGFLGARVVAELRANHHEVIAVRRPPEGPPTAAPFVDCDLSDASRVADVLAAHRP